MDLITVSEMDELPDDPMLAFVQLERICRLRLAEHTAQQERYDHADDKRIEYMTIVASAAEAYGIADFGEPTEGWDARAFDLVYKRAISIATKLTIESKRARSLSSVALPVGAKERLRKQLEDLRTALDAVELDEKRKKALHARLNEFEKEISQEKSNITKILMNVALVVAALNQASGAITGIQDLIIKLPETVNAINILLGREKLKELEATPDPLPLPASVTKALPAPKPPSTARDAGLWSSSPDDLDDEVPF